MNLSGEAIVAGLLAGGVAKTVTSGCHFRNITAEQMEENRRLISPTGG